MMLVLTAFSRDAEVVLRPAPRSLKLGEIKFKSVAARGMRIECTVTVILIDIPSERNSNH
jgi:hypothetical protein